MATTSNGGNSRPKFKTSFKSARTYSPIHTGGAITLTSNGEWLISTLNEQVIVTEVETGRRIGDIKGDSSAVTTLSVTPSPASPSSGGYVLTAHRSSDIYLTSLPSLAPHRTIAKAHEAPIITSAADPTGTLFATGSSDGVVKVWDAERGVCTHVFRGHGGVISALCFDIARPTSNVSNAANENDNDDEEEEEGDESGRARLISGADDCTIRIWDLRTRACLAILNGHVSVVRGLSITPNGRTLISGGRDKVINVWELTTTSSSSSSSKTKGKAPATPATTTMVGELRKTIPVFETLESVRLIRIKNSTKSVKGRSTAPAYMIYTGGDKGVVRLWDLRSGNQIETIDSSSTNGKIHEIVELIYTPLTNSITAIYVDQNIITRSLPLLATTRQIIGYNDEVIDTVLLSSSSPPIKTVSSDETAPNETTTTPKESHLAVATNSDLIRVYDLNRFSVSLLEGHKDVVLCLNRSVEGDILVSGSKDKTARIWRSTTLDQRSDGMEDWECIGIAEGHVESVGAIAVSKKPKDLGASFIITASQDRTAKVWDLASILSPSTEEGAIKSIRLRSLTTSKIHDKDINALDISPNSQLLASASQDRTAKLFSINHTPSSKNGTKPATANLKLLGTFKGHKRGVWSVKFSSVDMCVATGSGDRTIKIWNLSDFSCLKTFEGHSNSVLRVDFITRGMQLVSCASDGLVKVWNVKDEECATTLDGHDEKIWALAVSSDEKTIVSGGADSVITMWEDVTLEEELEKVAAREELVLKEQDFDNYLSLNDYSNAILLALSLAQPRRLLTLFTSLRLSPIDVSITGSSLVDIVLKDLLPDELAQMMGYLKEWNTTARNSEVAQGVLHALLKSHSSEKILEALEGKSKKVVLDDADDDDDEENVEDEINGGGVKGGATAAKLKREKARKQRMRLAKDRKNLQASEVLGALIPYTERHFSRADKMVRESFIVEHLLGMMEGLVDLDHDDDEEMEDVTKVVR